MAGDYQDSSNYIIGFQIHHIFPVEIFDNATLRTFLASAGIKIDMKGNKVALLASDTMASLVAGSPSLQPA